MKHLKCNRKQLNRESLSAIMLTELNGVQLPTAGKHRTYLISRKKTLEAKVAFHPCYTRALVSCIVLCIRSGLFVEVRGFSHDTS